MFGEINNVGYSNALSSAAIGDKSPQEYGVSSAVSDLIAAAKETTSCASDLRSVLGIGVPHQVPGKEMDASLVGSLKAVASMLRNANSELTDALRHIRA